LIDGFLNRVTCGDCLKLLKEMPDNSVDLIITDPPYTDKIRNIVSHLTPLD